jgi:multicomponent K+:H+ antiporter subunit C
MEFAIASGVGVLVAGGIYLLLRARTFDVILGLTLLSYATNLLIFSSGRAVVGKPPVLRPGVEAIGANYTDPLPQALVLTAIVIAFAMTAITVVVAMRNHADLHSDHVDGHEPEPKKRERDVQA